MMYASLWSMNSVAPREGVARAREEPRQLLRHDAASDALLDGRSEARDLVRGNATPVDDQRSFWHRDESSERLRRVVAVAHIELAVRHREDLPHRHCQTMA